MAMDKRFVKKILKAAEDLDTLVYLSFDSFEDAVGKWLKDFAESLDTLADIFSRGLDTKISASVYSLEEKKLERDNLDFLNRIQKYLDGVDLAFSRKSLQYVKIAKRFKKPSAIEEKQKLLLEGLEHIDGFKKALEKIRKVSAILLKESRSRNIHTLSKYKKQNARLELLSTLNFDKALQMLKEHGEI
jgi:hypothetical protein